MSDPNNRTRKLRVPEPQSRGVRTCGTIILFCVGLCILGILACLASLIFGFQIGGRK